MPAPVDGKVVCLHFVRGLMYIDQAVHASHVYPVVHKQCHSILAVAHDLVANIEDERPVPYEVQADPLAVDVHIGILIYSAEGHEHWPAFLGVHLNPGPIPSPLVVAFVTLILPGLSNVDSSPVRIVEVWGDIGGGLLLRIPALIEAEFPLHGHLGHLFISVGDHWRRVGVVIVVLIRSTYDPLGAWGPDPLEVEALPLDGLQLSL